MKFIFNLFTVFFVLTTFSATANSDIVFIDAHQFNNDKARQARHIIKQPLSNRPGAVKSSIKVLSLPALNLEDLRNNAVNKHSKNGLKALEFALPYKLGVNFTQIAPYTNTVYNSESYRVYRLLLDSENALSLNFGFDKFSLPESASLFFYDNEGKNIFGPVTSKDNDEHEQYWTPSIATNKVIIELNIAEKDIPKLKLHLSSVNQGFIDIYQLEKEINSLKTGACNIDVVCEQSANWQEQINSVAMYQINGFRVCSGGMLNNTGRVTRTFLTAEHCNISQSNVASMVVIWNFENSFCRQGVGGVGDANVKYVNSGARLLAKYFDTDMTLVSLDDPIPYNANVYLAGWNRGAQAPTSAVAIHHPGVLEKRISFENDPTIISGYVSNFGNTHIRVVDWDLGTTETGSSGSPLFDQNKLVVGQLHGGFAACGNNESDYYGRLAMSWNGGGTPATRLRDWLDPINTGAMTIAGRAYNSIFKEDVFEPDNAATEYGVLTINQAPQRHTIHNPQDIDWFGFTLGEELPVQIVTDGLQGDTYISVFDESGNLVAVNDDGGRGSFSLIQQTLPPGFYLVSVVGLNSLGENEAIEEYTISLTSDAVDEECDFFIIPVNNAQNVITVCL